MIGLVIKCSFKNSHKVFSLALSSWGEALACFLSIHLTLKASRVIIMSTLSINMVQMCHLVKKKETQTVITNRENGFIAYRCFLYPVYFCCKVCFLNPRQWVDFRSQVVIRGTAVFVTLSSFFSPKGWKHFSLKAINTHCCHSASVMISVTALHFHSHLHSWMDVCTACYQTCQSKTQ